jgi:hypothetical protein
MTTVGDRILEKKKGGKYMVGYELTGKRYRVLTKPCESKVIIGADDCLECPLINQCKEFD